VERVITDDWLVAWPTDCAPVIDRVLSRPGLRAGAVLWLTEGPPNVEARWAVCLQGRARTWVEQRGYVRLAGHDPRVYTPEVVRWFAARHGFHWALSLPGGLGADCVRMLRAAGAWALRGDPVRHVEHLDGGWFFVAAWRPGWGGCRVLSSTGAVYAGRAAADRLEAAVHGWCRRSPDQFRRAADRQRWLGWLPLLGPWSALWRGG
jgi:hypothetical protein